jgi:hypothetical protein
MKLNVKIPEPQAKTIDDLAVIMTVYGSGRADLARTALGYVKRQTLPHTLVLVEVVAKGQGSALLDVLSDYPNSQLIIVESEDRHEGLFQKEACWNIGAKSCDHKKLVFMDADFVVAETNWLEALSTSLDRAKNSVIQGFRFVLDTEDYAYRGYGIGTIALGPFPEFRKPGLCWAMNRSFFEELRGFNPYVITGAGDCVFMEEVFGKQIAENKLKWVQWTDWSRNLIRKNMPQACVDFVPFSAFHLNHGPLTERVYDFRFIAVGQCFKDIKKAVYLDGNGLIAWHKPDCPLRNILARKDEMTDIWAVYKICEEELGKQIVITW